MEAAMSREERREAVRILIAEVRNLAAADFKFAEEDPSDERTYLWDPIDYVCNVLEISRVCLSRYSVELTGMRAHELTDSMKAEKLPGALRARLEAQFTRLVPDLEAILASLKEGADPLPHALKFVQKSVCAERSGVNKLRWAIELGFASASRLARAYSIRFETSVYALEDEILRTLVQKFFDARAAAVAPIESSALEPEVQAKTPARSVHELAALEKLKAELGMEGELSREELDILEALLEEAIKTPPAA